MIDERPLFSIAVYGAAIGVAENREAVGVIVRRLPLDTVREAGLSCVRTGLYSCCRCLESIGDEVFQHYFARVEREKQTDSQ